MTFRRNVFLVLATMLPLAACGGEEAQTDAADAADEASAPAGDAAAPAATATPAASGMIDPDAASREELMSIPGFDAALADSLIAARPFADMTAVDRVLAGRLDEAARDSVYTRLWKPLDLNTATGDEILLIPGVGERMKHEFEEYRPYRSIEQFRREIGKYVDSTEVARLEQYVTIR